MSDKPRFKDYPQAREQKRQQIALRMKMVKEVSEAAPDTAVGSARIVLERLSALHDDKVAMETVATLEKGSGIIDFRATFKTILDSFHTNASGEVMSGIFLRERSARTDDVEAFKTFLVKFASAVNRLFINKPEYDDLFEGTVYERAPLFAEAPLTQEQRDKLVASVLSGKIGERQPKAQAPGKPSEPVIEAPFEAPAPVQPQPVNEDLDATLQACGIEAPAATTSIDPFDTTPPIDTSDALETAAGQGDDGETSIEDTAIVEERLAVAPSGDSGLQDLGDVLADDFHATNYFSAPSDDAAGGGEVSPVLLHSDDDSRIGVPMEDKSDWATNTQSPGRELAGIDDALADLRTDN
ncbi:MAG: hypothetical protein V1760_01425, partial [Candidatus Peregrinibacteria bacterium]